MAEPAKAKWTDDEKKMLMISLNTLVRSITVTIGRSKMPLVVEAYEKQLAVVRSIMNKVGEL